MMAIQGSSEGEKCVCCEQLINALYVTTPPPPLSAQVSRAVGASGAAGGGAGGVPRGLQLHGGAQVRRAQPLWRHLWPAGAVRPRSGPPWHEHHRLTSPPPPPTLRALHHRTSSGWRSQVPPVRHHPLPLLHLPPSQPHTAPFWTTCRHCGAQKGAALLLHGRSAL